jgi:hypothetical protein
MNIVDWTMIREGEPIGNIYGYKSNGIIQLNEDSRRLFLSFPRKIARYGDRKYIDKNHDGKLTIDDYFKLGNTNLIFHGASKTLSLIKNFNSLTFYTQDITV